MKQAKLIILDEVNCEFVGLEPAMRRACYDEMKYFLHAARHTPAYKLGRWDGCVSYFAINGKTYLNLLDKVLPKITEKYEIEVEDHRLPHPDFIFPEIDEYYLQDYLDSPVWPEKHPAAGQAIMLRDYQVGIIKAFAENNQALQEVPTGAGKTLLTATLSHMVQDYGRSIVIVPNKDLVKQTESDYLMLGLDAGVYFGDRKDINKTHTICTWQSLNVMIKNEKEGKTSLKISDFLKDVVAVIVDEAHGSKSKVMQELLCGPFSNVPLRWGLTGTLPREEHELSALLSSIGPVVHKLSAKTLMDLDVLSSCHIHILQLLDSIEFETFHHENAFLVSDPNHLDWLSEFARLKAKEGNTLVLINRIETGKELIARIPEATFVHGTVNSNDRKETYDSISDVNNKIVIASFGVAAVGINIPRIFNLILVEAGKSHIRVIQSIGRGIRRAKDKDFVDVYDISSNCKFSSKHMKERIKTYKRIDYPHSVTKIDYLKQLSENKVGEK